jgi:hypothetical protein
MKRNRLTLIAGKKVFLPAHPGHDNSGFRSDGHNLINHMRSACVK